MLPGGKVKRIKGARLRGLRQMVSDAPTAPELTSATYRINNVRLRSWVSVIGDRALALWVYVRPDAPAEWAGLGDPIVASLERIAR